MPPSADPTGVPLRVVLVVADVLAVVLAWMLLRTTVVERLPFGAWLGGMAVAVAVALTGLATAGLYRSRVSSVRAVELARLPRVASVSAAVGLLAASELADQGLPILHVVLGAGVSVCTLVLARGSFDAYMRHARAKGRFCRSLVVIGGGSEAGELRELLSQHPELGFRLAGRVSDDPADDASGLPMLGAIDDVVDVCAAAGANGVLITAAEMSDADRTPLVNRLLAAGLHVHLSAGLRGLDPRRLRVVPIAHEPLFYVEPTSLQPYQLRVKRVFDLVLATVLVVLALPVVAVAAIAIKCTDRGPVIFRQRRIGRHGQPFRVYKLRTMRVGAEAEQAELANARTGPLFKATNDPRVTPVGRFLRLSSIDELPQLLNVLKGEMSLVGPRPALAHEVAQFDSDLLRRLDVPPGMTGIWQVEARDVPAFDAYRRLDLYYVENWRFSLDLVCLVLTFQVVASRLVRAVLGRPWRDDAVVPADAVVLD